MTKLILLISLSVTVLVVSRAQESRIVVTDSSSKKENPIYLVKYEDEPLELTCSFKNNSEEELPLHWRIKSSDDNRTIEEIGDVSVNETSVAESQNITLENGTLRLYLSHLQIGDSGIYMCSSINSTELLNHTITLIVRPKRISCDKKFECEDNQCISNIFKCDGVIDCKSRNDEAEEICGKNPCDGKIKCNNGRCIPKDWCKPCDPSRWNCTNRHRPDCCPQLGPYTYIPNDGSYPQRYNDFGDHSNSLHRYDINFVQTTIYTIIGCALVFMIIVTILVIAICRVHMKRSPSTHIPNNRRVFATTAYHRAFTQEIGVYDLDISLNRPDGLGLLVTYNINNGVQIVGSPIDPPPYSEVASLPPREGPPPPYTISQPCDGNSELSRLRGVIESPPKSGRSSLRTGFNGRVSSEPSLLNLDNRL